MNGRAPNYHFLSSTGNNGGAHSKKHSCHAPATTRSLKEQLLEWIDGVPTYWKWYFCPVEDRLSAKEGLLWRVYSQHLGRASPRQGKSKYCRTKRLQKEPPEEIYLAMVLKQGPFIIHQGSGALKNGNIPIRKISAVSFDQERLKRRALD
jgi:hypothetical protein